MKKKKTESLLRLLRLLRPQLHQSKDERVTRHGENYTDACVSPSVVIIVQVDGVEVITAALVLADMACTGSIGVGEICSGAGATGPGGEVLATCLTRGRIEDGEFGFLADDGDVEVYKGKEGAHKVVVSKYVSMEFLDEEGKGVVLRVEIVHPISPKLLNLTIWNEDTAEGNQSTDEERIDERGEDSVGCVCGDELAHPGVNHLVDQHDEEDCSRFIAIGREAAGIIEADEIKHRADAKIWNLGNDVTSDKGGPRIHLRFLLADFEKVPSFDEERL